MTTIWVFLGILAFGIVITNFLVMYLLVKRRSLRTPTNICLASMALSDFLAGSVGIPLIIACNVRNCKIQTPLLNAMVVSQRLISSCTVIHLLIVTVERYIMICHGMKYNIWINTRRVVAVLTGTWIFSAFVALIQLSWQQMLPKQRAEKIDKTYDIICLCTIVIAPLLVMAVSYLRIFVALRHQLQQIQKYNNPTEKSNDLRRRQVERKAAIIFGCMIVAFTVCWFSYYIDGIINLDYNSSVILLFFRFVSPIINPLLYTFLKEDFKQAVKLTLFGRNREVTTNSCLYQTNYAPSTAAQPDVETKNGQEKSKERLLQNDDDI